LFDLFSNFKKDVKPDTMKRSIALSILTATALASFAQDADSVSSSGPFGSNLRFQTKNQNIYVTRENIAFMSNNLQPSALENEIIDLESRECKALKERDPATLHQLWSRDFTLDNQQNKLVDSQNALPNYMSIGRMVEKIAVLDINMVTTSGTESYQQVKGSKIETNQRKFFHTWTRRFGTWKLTTNSYQ
jgi:hypothetical protein